MNTVWIIAMVVYFGVNIYVAGVALEENKRDFKVVGVVLVQLALILFFIIYFIGVIIWDILLWFAKLFQLKFFWMYYVRKDIHHLANERTINIAKQVLDRFKQKRMPRYLIYKYCYELTVAVYEKKKEQKTEEE